MIIWLIGLSGSGKSTIGKELAGQLRCNNDNLVYLDGDILRTVWGDSLGHTVEARAVNAHRISYLCKMLDQQGIHVVASVLSLFPEWQKWNRDNFNEYFEIFLDVPLCVLKERDPKGIYSRAERGEEENVVGIDILFPKPPEPDLVIAQPEILQSPLEIVEMILVREEFKEIHNLSKE